MPKRLPWRSRSQKVKCGAWERSHHAQVLPFGIRGDLGDEGADLLVVASQAEEGAIEVGVVGARIVARQFAAKESRPHSIHIPGSVVVGQQDRGDGIDHTL